MPRPDSQGWNTALRRRRQGAKDFIPLAKVWDTETLKLVQKNSELSKVEQMANSNLGLIYEGMSLPL